VSFKQLFTVTPVAWRLMCRYTDQQLDREFIEVLRETCFKLVERSEVRSSVVTHSC
jgi:hypothetical protein